MISDDVHIITTRQLDEIRLDAYRRGRANAFAEANDPNPVCHASRDGECSWELCPQNREGEPAKSGRHCPLDQCDDGD